MTSDSARSSAARVAAAGVIQLLVYDAVVRQEPLIGHPQALRVVDAIVLLILEAMVAEGEEDPGPRPGQTIH